MSDVKVACELNRVDIELGDKKARLQQLDALLAGNEAVNAARAALAEAAQKLSALEQELKELDQDIKTLADKVKQSESQLFSGGKGSKELMGMQKEADLLKGKKAGLEDRLLEVMEKAEAARAEVKERTLDLTGKEKGWEGESVKFVEERRVLEKEIAKREEVRAEIAAQLTPQMREKYEHLRSTRGRAAAKVERGMCQGCRIIMPVGEWQRVRSGALVQCSSCGRILCLD